MIICVSRHEAPPRLPTRLRSLRPHAAASDRVLSLTARTKLPLSLRLPPLIFLVLPVGFLFCWDPRPNFCDMLLTFIRKGHSFAPRAIGGTTYFPIRLGNARLGYVTPSGVEVFTDH